VYVEEVGVREVDVAVAVLVQLAHPWVQRVHLLDEVGVPHLLAGTDLQLPKLPAGGDPPGEVVLVVDEEQGVYPQGAVELDPDERGRADVVVFDLAAEPAQQREGPVQGREDIQTW